MERHHRDLEAEAREQENEPEHESQMSGACAALGRRLGDAGKVHGAGEAVDQRRAVKQHARGQGAEDEILEARLGRAHGIAIDGGDHVEREAHQFEPEIERDQIGRRDEHHHPGGREQDQDRIFEPLLLLGREIVGGHQDRGRRSGQCQQLEETGEVVDDEAVAKGDEPARRQPDDDGAGEDQQQDRRTVDAPGRLLATECADHQQRHGAEREHDFRQSRQQGGNFERFGHRRISPLVNAPARRRLSPRRARARSSRAVASPKPPRSRVPASGRCRAGWSE